MSGSVQGAFEVGAGRVIRARMKTALKTFLTKTSSSWAALDIQQNAFLVPNAPPRRVGDE